MNQSFSTLTRGVLAAAALTFASTSAHAVFSISPQPFPGFPTSYVIDLQAAGHAPVVLPGLGVSATDFIISNFDGFAVPSAIAGGTRWTYTDVTFEAVDGVTPVASLTGPGNTMVVDVLGQDFFGSPVEGTFTMVLQTATFTDGTLTTFLNPGFAAPTGQLVIAAVTGGYEVTTPALEINAQYTIGGGAPIDVPPLVDANGQPSAVPEPMTLGLLVPGLIGVFGARRRAAA